MEFGAAHEDRARGGAGINPHIQRVVGLGGGFGPCPAGRLERGPEFGGGFLEPDIRAVLLDQRGGVAHDLGVEDRVALRVVERRDRHAPGALARDAPVGPAFDGGLDAALAPVGHPVHAVDLVERPLAEGK